MLSVIFTIVSLAASRPSGTERRYISFLCCITNHHTLSGLKQYPFIISKFCKSDNHSCSTEFYSQTYKAKVKTLARFNLGRFNLEGLGKYPHLSSFRLWQKLVPCGCRTEAPVSLFAISCWLLLDLAGRYQVLALWPLHLSTAVPSYVPNFPEFLLPARGKSLLFKGSHD